MSNIYDFLKRYQDKNPLRFHTPGHKGKLEGRDITELNIYDLGRSSKLLVEAQKNTAKLYGAKYTNYLVSGSTSGILAMISAIPKGKIIVGRASHKSVFNGCILAGVEPIIVDNEMCDSIAKPLSPEQISKAVLAHPDVDAVLITTPNYYGQNSDLAKIKEAIGDRYLLVDGAHGAHFGFFEGLPENAGKYADAVVLSAHKTLPAYTQTAYLNVNDDKLQEQIEKYFSLSETTSPSFMFWAGLEYAAQYAHDNANHFAKLKKAIEQYLPMRKPNDDFTRIVIDLDGYAISGYEADLYLQKEFNIYCEFGNERYIVFIISIMDSVEDVKLLGQAVSAMLSKFKKHSGDYTAIDYAPKAVRAMSFIDAARQETEWVSLEESEGRICAREAGSFPPCLPLITRGEIITRQIIDSLKNIKCFGLHDDKIEVIK